MSQPKIIPGVRRFDAPEPMAKPEHLENGWLRCDAVLTKTGVFKYLNADGTERRELRLPAQVFDKASMSTFHLVPVTDDHPECGWLDATNTQTYQRGSVDMPKQDGDKMRAKLLITDAALAAKILNREKTQVSNGYFADLELRSGEYEGESFDAVQTNIRGNHVAIVDEARAGPDARIKLDGADAVMVGISRPGAKPDGVKKMAVQKIRIDKIDFEDVPVAAAQAMEARFKKLEEKLDEKRAKIEELTADNARLSGRGDAIVAELKKTQDALKVARDPKTLSGLVNSRVKLVSQAKELIGDEFNADALSEREIKAAVVAKLSPSLKLDGKSDEYVNASFDALVARSEEGGGIEDVRTVIHADTFDKSADNKSAKKDPRDAFIEDSQSAWKRPLPSTAKRNGKA